MIKVIMADDHVIVRQSIVSVLERKNPDIKVVAEVSNGKELLQAAKKYKADVYIIDISMPILNGIDATLKITKMQPNAKIIMLSMFDDRVSVENAVKAGANAFVVKEASINEIIEAINEVCAGKFFLCSQVAKYLIRGFLDNSTDGRRVPQGHLTHKERQILQLISEGYSSKTIAEEFNLSLNTIHVHRNNIMKKLNIHKQAELIRYAIKEGIAHI